VRVFEVFPQRKLEHLIGQAVIPILNNEIEFFVVYFVCYLVMRLLLLIRKLDFDALSRFFVEYYERAVDAVCSLKTLNKKYCLIMKFSR